MERAAIPAQARKAVRSKTWTLANLRFGLQALTFAGFLAQGILYYVAHFRPLGNLLPFLAYQSVGAEVVSSALLLWGAIFLLTMIFGRLVCGWICPIGFLQDAGERLLRRLKVELPEPASQPPIVRYALLGMILLHFTVVPLLATPVRFWQLDLRFPEPWLLGFPFHVSLFVLDLACVFLVIGIGLPLIFGPRSYCRLVCETGLLLDHSSRLAFGKIRRNHGFDRDACISCQKCSNNCPQGIDVFEEVHQFDKVVSSDCISCLQCVELCPVDTIVYSLRKQVVDQGKVAGYLAQKRTQLRDLPRYTLTAAGAIAGGYLGFAVLRPSYFHTYLMFSSLGGAAGWLLWRLFAGRFLSEQTLLEASRTQVERESAAQLPVLSNKEKVRLQLVRPVRGWFVPAAIVSLAVLGALVTWVIRSTPTRMLQLDDISPAHRTPGGREADRTFHFGIPPELGAHDLEATYGPLAAYLSKQLSTDVRLVTADSYNALAHALEDGRLDASLLPPLGYLALHRRAPHEVQAIAQVLGSAGGDGARYHALLVVREDGPRTIDALRGRRLALTSLDSLSGYLEPVHVLSERGLHLSDLSDVILAGDHTRALRLLAAGQVDCAATFDGALAEFEQRHPDVQLRTLASSDPLPQDLVVARSDQPAAAIGALRSALLELDEQREPELRASLSRADVRGFGVPDEADFAALRELGQ